MPYGYGMRMGVRPDLEQLPEQTGINPVLQGIQIGQQQQGNEQRLQLNALALQQRQQAAQDQQQFNQLASQAYTAPVDQRATLLGRMAALDPKGASEQATTFGALDKAKQAAVQQRLEGIAQKFAAIAQDPDPQRQQQEYDAMIAQGEASGKDMTMYKNVPPKIGARMALMQIADTKTLMQANGMGTGAKPDLQDGYQIITGPDGKVQAIPVPIGGAQGGSPGGLPAETQAYPGKIFAALGNAPPFDANGQPTSQLLDAVLKVESGGNPNAVSPAGAQGPYQLMPATATSVGVSNPFDPVQARAGASRYLAQLYKMANGNPQVALEMYDAGPARVEQSVHGPQTLPEALAARKGQQGAFTTLDPKQVADAGLPKGTVAQVGANGEIHVVSKPGGNDGPAQVFGDPTKTGDAYLASLDPAMQRQVLALDQGRMQFPSSFALKTPYWQGLLQAVGQYDPSFDAVNYNSRNQTRKNFTSGKEAQQVNALNTVAQHLAQLQSDANALGNRGFTPWNAVANAAESKMGAPQLTNFERDRLPVVQELERVWRGTGGSEGDIQEWTKNLSSSSSQAQFNDAFAHIANLIHGKLAALRDQYMQGMGNTHDAFKFLTPSTRAIFQSLGGEPVGNETTAPGEGPHTGAAPGSPSHIPAPAIQYLKAHPETAAQFDAQFGPGSAQAVMQ